jgi:hypothetical protein
MTSRSNKIRIVHAQLPEATTTTWRKTVHQSSDIVIKNGQSMKFSAVYEIDIADASPGQISFVCNEHLSAVERTAVRLLREMNVPVIAIASFVGCSNVAVEILCSRTRTEPLGDDPAADAACESLDRITNELRRSYEERVVNGIVADTLDWLRAGEFASLMEDWRERHARYSGRSQMTEKSAATKNPNVFRSNH